MKNCHYLHPRPKFSRTMRPSDLQRLGQTISEDLVWSPANRFTLVLPDAVSDSLAEAFPKEFRSLPIAGVEAPAPADDSSSSQTAGDPDSSSDPSDPDENDGDESSSSDDDPDA